MGRVGLVKVFYIDGLKSLIFFGGGTTDRKSLTKITGIPANLSLFHADPHEDFGQFPSGRSLQPTKTFHPLFFIAKVAKNCVLVSLDACSLPNQILTFSIPFIIPINSCST